MTQRIHRSWRAAAEGAALSPTGTQDVEDQAARHDAGEAVRVVERRCDLDHVHADDAVMASDSPHQWRDLPEVDAAGRRSHDSRHLRRVEAVGVDG